MTKSRQALNGKIVHVSKNVAIYRIHASPFWRARIWIPSLKKRIVRSTKSSVRIEAIKIAEEYARELSNATLVPSTPKQYTFGHFAELFLTHQAELIAQGKRHPKLQRNDSNHLKTERAGLLEFFGSRDIREIHTKDVLDYLTHLRTERPEARASSTFNHVLSTFRKVMITARDRGVISEIPSTPRPERIENPRPYFRFHPVVEKHRDEYKMLLTTAKRLGDNLFKSGRVTVTPELYDLILWQIHTFMRPTASEVFAVRFQDVEITENPKRLQITLRRGKTGYRVVNSLEAAVSVYKRIMKRTHTRSDYLFAPSLKQRQYVPEHFSKMFRLVLNEAGIATDQQTTNKHTLYSLRHTAICMRLVNSGGKVNLFSVPIR